MLFASLWRSSTKIGMWFTPYISVLLDVHGDYIIKGNRSIFDLPSFFGNLLKHILVFVDMKQFFAQHQIVFVDNRSLFVQRQFFFLTQNCFLCITNFLFWTLFRIFLLSCSNKNRITCQKERNHFHRTQNFFYIQFLNCKLAACWSSSQWSSKQRQLFEKHLWRAQISVKLQAFLLQFFQNEHSNRYFSRVLTRF